MIRVRESQITLSIFGKMNDDDKKYNQHFMQVVTKSKSKHLENWFTSDFQFHQLYPFDIQLLANKHWTPLNIIQKVVPFLVPEDGVKILDIGSGVGKFCLSGAYFKSKAQFYGIEQRKNLCGYAEDAKNVLGLMNVSFIHGNFTQLDLKQYDNFYFYNSFFENINGSEKIDNTILYSESLYDYYSQYLYNQFEKMPLGTRVATCCSWDDEIPPDYHLLETHSNKLLKFWIKK